MQRPSTSPSPSPQPPQTLPRAETEDPPSLQPSPLPPDDQATSPSPIPLGPESSLPSTTPPQTDPPVPDPPPTFSPFFTILSSSASTHHPSTQYVFADDSADSNPITAAALDILDPASPPESPSSSGDDTKRETEDAPAPRRKPRRERYIILDLDATGTKVVNAQSMSSDWAVTAAEIGPAPAWDTGATGREEDDAERGMMLRIEGVECLDAESGTNGKEGKGKEVDRGQPQQQQEKSLEALAEEYERRMGELRKVMDALEKGQEGLKERAEQEGN